MSLALHVVGGWAVCVLVALAGSHLADPPIALIAPSTMRPLVDGLPGQLARLRPDPCRTGSDAVFPSLTPPSDLLDPAPTMTSLQLHYRYLRRCTGARPTSASTVVLRYAYWRGDGEPASRGFRPIPIGGLPPALRDGILRMRVGDRARAWIAASGMRLDGMVTPLDLDVPRNVVVIEVELVAIAT